MKGDFSRLTFDRAKRYKAVLMQQGRVQVDADWNEQDAIEDYRVETEAVDVIGGCGAPEADAGFAISESGGEFFIGEGRYYVDGLLAENDLEDLKFVDQPDRRGAGDPLADLKSTSLALFYLDVWERHITALDDERLRERALGGPDTTSRIKTVWQVRSMAVGPAPPELQQNLRVLKKRAAASEAQYDALVEKYTRATGDEREAVAKGMADLKRQLEELGSKVADLVAATRINCDTDFPEWDDLFGKTQRTLNARTVHPPVSKDPCEVPPTAGFRRLENQLYRVEVHKPGPIGTATFKWSRENGTVVSLIDKIDGDKVTVRNLGGDEVLTFFSGDWVELTDDSLELEGKPGEMLSIKEPPNPNTNEITLDGTPSLTVVPANHPKLRRWDQHGAGLADGVPTAGGWIDLEDGIQVSFQTPGSDVFQVGDYWLVPARVVTGEIEWPPYALPNAAPLPQPPLGIKHHYCKLAIAMLDDRSGKIDVVDCRDVFPPLTGLEKQALHVIETSWINDETLAVDDLAATRFRIALDGVPDARSITNDSVIASIEAFWVVGDQVFPSYLVPLVLVGNVGLDPSDPNIIEWRLSPDSLLAPLPPTSAPSSREFLINLFRTASGGTLDLTTTARELLVARLGRPSLRAVTGAEDAVAAREAAASAASTAMLLRMRFTVKGHLVWRVRQDESLIYLDGQAFGYPARRAGTTVSRHGLRFPTGDGMRASDFESWLWLALDLPQTPAVLTLTANPRNIELGGSTNAEARVLDAGGALLPGVRVAFSSDLLRAGGLNGRRSRSVVSDAAGIARVVYYGPNIGNGTVSATTAGIAATVDVEVHERVNTIVRHLWNSVDNGWRGDLGVSWELSPDGLSLTVNLDEDVLEDGTTFNSESCAAILDANRGRLEPLGYVDARAIDDRTLVISSRNPIPEKDTGELSAALFRALSEIEFVVRR